MVNPAKRRRRRGGDDGGDGEGSAGGGRVSGVRGNGAGRLNGEMEVNGVDEMKEIKMVGEIQEMIDNRGGRI